MNEIEVVGAEASRTWPAAAEGAVEGHAKRSDRPWIFGLLICPSAAMMNGVVQGGVLAFLLSQQGIGSGAQSKFIALLSIPTWLYFVWSPVTDFFVKRRTWLVGGSVLAAAFMAMAFRSPHLTSGAAKVLLLLSACCSQLVISSCGGMMGALSTARAKNVAGGFYQAGSMGYGALATWALITASSRMSAPHLGLLAAAIIVLPVVVAVAAPAQDEMSKESFGATMSRVGAEFKATFLRPEAIPYIGCMVFPMGSGAAISLLPGVAKFYGVNGDSVAWINGLLGALLMGGGSMLMGAIRYKARASVMYMVVSLVNCAALGILWLGPMRPGTYLAGLIAYLFTIGACYAMFTAVLLEFMGDSGKSGSTRYSLINSLGNLPVQYMLLVDGIGGDRWGGRGVAGAEAVVGAVGASVLLVWLLALRPKPAEAYEVGR